MTATWSEAKPPTAAIWMSHQGFHALSDRNGKMSLW